MGHVLKLKDGSEHTVFGLEDLLQLMEDQMGIEAAEVMHSEISDLEELDAVVDDLTIEFNEVKEKHRESMTEIRHQAGIIMNLLNAKDIDRKALRDAARSISEAAWRERT